MVHRLRRLAIALLLVGGAALVYQYPEFPGKGEASFVVKVPGPTLRSIAQTSPRPIYPESSLALKVEGRVVATISVNRYGQTVSAEILEAPDSAIGRSVQDALWRWRFRLPNEMSKRRVTVTSRLVFYFVIAGEAGLVLDPREAAARKAHEGSP